MPGIYTLSDGRLIAVWNNTQPLAELDHTRDHVLPLDPGEIAGEGEDVWLYGSDEHIGEYAHFSFVLDGNCQVNRVKVADNNTRFKLKVSFNLDTNRFDIEGPGREGISCKDADHPAALR